MARVEEFVPDIAHAFATLLELWADAEAERGPYLRAAAKELNRGAFETRRLEAENKALNRSIEELKRRLSEQTEGAQHAVEEKTP